MAYELLRLGIPHRIEGGEFPERIEIEEDTMSRYDLESEVRYYVPERTCKRVFLDDWLWKCSECGSRHDSGHLYNFCPNCGAKVVDE